MKDLVKVAKTVAQNADPKKAALTTRYQHEEARIANFKPDAKANAHKQTQEAIAQAAKQRLDAFQKKSAISGIEYRDLTVELTHAHYNASLLDLDAKTMKYAAEKKIDLTAAVHESREYKKRLKAFLTAVAHKDAAKLDKALASLQSHMKATKPKFLSVGEIQKVMGHSTATQANYFKKFGHLLGVVTASRSNQIPMDVNLDHSVTQDFLAL